MTTNDIDLYPTVAARIGDPGAYVARKLTPSGEPMESVPRWAARAVMAAVEPVIEQLRAELEKVRGHRDALADIGEELRAQLTAANHHTDGLAAERARTQETTGRCGNVAPSLSLLASRTRPTCRLTAGHAGWHRGDDDSEWTLTEETHR